ncbi:MAG: hypothetical protein AB1649_23255 [Chloroflexota bacterium]
MSRNETIILAFARHGNDITIRIDKNGLAQRQFEGLPVTELTLTECKEPESLLDQLTVDHSIDYEITEKSGETTVLFCINYSTDEFEVTCRSTSKTETDYTVEDWRRKTERLAQLYLETDVSDRLYEFMYFLLRENLVKMIGKEIDSGQRKIEFLGKTSVESAANLTGQLQAYRKVLARIGMGEIDGQPMAHQMSEWVSHIWDDRIENQVAYAQSVEDKISELGDAALFPLLDMIRKAIIWDERDRYELDELLHLLGVVDQAVQQKAAMILEPYN